MLPTYRFASFEISAFTFWLTLGALMSVGVALGIARLNRQRILPLLDCAVGATLFGVVGARIGHILLHWDYFVNHQSEIPQLSAGGLNWHGALFGSLLGALVVALIRRIKVSQVWIAGTLAVPIMAGCTWIACYAVNAAYGVEVRSLADFPTWLVVEAPDVYGAIAPRLALHQVGIWLAGLMVIISCILLRFARTREMAIWVGLIQLGFGMALIDFFRADYVPLWFGRRADQVLDLVVVLAATIALAVALFARVRAAYRPTVTNFVS
jgi:prolipoprotein diacylglyceryltransferase